MCDTKMKGGDLKMGCYGNSCCGVSGRGFLTRDEKLNILKEYKESLERETKGVTERISELEKD